MKRSRRVSLASWSIAGSFLAAACSLAVPEEEEFFGTDDSDSQDGGTAGRSGGTGGTAGSGGSAPNGGRIEQPGAGEGGMDAGGAGAGGEGIGGGAGVGAEGGAPPSAGGTGSGEGGLGGEGGSGGEVSLPPFEAEDGLIVHYRFDETEGAAVPDELSVANDGTIVGTATWVEEGKIGGALRLSGSTTYVDFPPAFLNDLEEMTIALWYNQEIRTAWTRVLDIGSSDRHWFYFSPAAARTGEQLGPHLAIDISDSVASELHILEPFPAPSQWAHVAITWTHTELTCYINGELAGSKPIEPAFYPYALVTYTPASTVLRAWLGRSSFSADAYFTGMVDDFRVYERALSASDVVQLHALTE